MSTNELIETPAEIENDAEEATEEAAPEVATEGAKETPPEKTPEQIEIERLRRALTKRDRTQGRMHQELQQRDAELARFRQAQPAPQPADAAPKEPDLAKVVEREALTLAERIASQREFDANCNRVAAEGKKEFSDFSDSLNALIEEAGPIVGPDGSPTPLGDVLLSTDAPAKLIQYLGKHPEIAAELDGLSTARLGLKLAAIQHEMAAKPKVSAAPKPIEPVSGKSGAPIGYSPEMTDAQYRKWREAQRKK
jgi:hypothetical protein